MKIEWRPEYFNKEVNLSYDDQRWIWEDASRVYIKQEEKSKTDVSVNGNVNGTCKNGANTELFLGKHKVITKLNEYTRRPCPRKIALLLEKLFMNPDTKEGHWLYVARHWNQRSINWVILGMIKQHRRGETSIYDPAKYFTSRIQYRLKKKKFRSTNDTYKRQ